MKKVEGVSFLEASLSEILDNPDLERRDRVGEVFKCLASEGEQPHDYRFHIRDHARGDLVTIFLNSPELLRRFTRLTEVDQSLVISGIRDVMMKFPGVREMRLEIPWARNRTRTLLVTSPDPSGYMLTFKF